jgi:uncharacterized protein (TIGR02588 family)
MSRIKTVAIVLIVIAIVAASIWIYYQLKSEPSKPEFEIVELSGFWAETGPWKGYRIEFRVKNNGTGEANLIHGTVEFDNASREWNTWQDVVKPGETSPIIFVHLGESKPNEQSLIIFVQCHEKVTQQFIEFLPPY